VDPIGCCCRHIVFIYTHRDTNRVVEHTCGTAVPVAPDASPAPATGMALGAHRLNQFTSSHYHCSIIRPLLAERSPPSLAAWSKTGGADTPCRLDSSPRPYLPSTVQRKRVGLSRLVLNQAGRWRGFGQ